MKEARAYAIGMVWMMILLMGAPPALAEESCEEKLLGAQNKDELVDAVEFCTGVPVPATLCFHDGDEISFAEQLSYTVDAAHLIVNREEALYGIFEPTGQEQGMWLYAVFGFTSGCLIWDP